MLCQNKNMRPMFCTRLYFIIILIFFVAGTQAWTRHAAASCRNLACVCSPSRTSLWAPVSTVRKAASLAASRSSTSTQPCCPPPLRYSGAWQLLAEAGVQSYPVREASQTVGGSSYSDSLLLTVICNVTWYSKNPQNISLFDAMSIHKNTL